MEDIFSFGDVCLTPSNEIKSVVSMYQYGTIIASNMYSVAMKKEPTLEIPKEFHVL